MAEASTSSDVPPLAKSLASTEKKVRDKAIKSLSAFLSDPSHDALPKLEMAKLWKGIFYCFWMSDKPLVQQVLATDIAEIVLSIPKTSAALAFLRGFWEATVLEWGGIDYLRIDKYYMLVRRFVNVSFRLLMREEWDDPVCLEYNSTLMQQGGPLCPQDLKVPTSLAYHLADIYLEELDKVFATLSVPDTLPAPVTTLCTPLLNMLAKTRTNATYSRIQSAFLEPLLEACSTPTTSDREDEEDEERSRKRLRLSDSSYCRLLENACTDSHAKVALTKGTLKRALLKWVFEVASAEETRDANRRKLYALVKSYTDDEDDS